MTELCFFDSVTRIEGVAAKTEAKLNSMGIFTVGDLLEYFPRRYEDRRRSVLSSRMPENMNILAEGVLTNKRIRRSSGGKVMIECTFSDAGGTFRVLFFNMQYMFDAYKEGTTYSVFGKMKRVGGSRTFVNPDVNVKGSPGDMRGILPIYRVTKGVTVNRMRKWVRYALDNISGDGLEWLAGDIIERNKLCDLKFAYGNIHFPSGEAAYRAARYRSIYDELLTYQLAIRKNKAYREGDIGDSSIKTEGYELFEKSLPYELTPDQKKAIDDIAADLKDKKPMNRLVEGDVGCGKTAVASAAIFMAVKGGKQAAFMAPTSLLATQHYANLREMFAPHGMNVVLLIGDMTPAQKMKAKDMIASGEADIAIGTHALISEGVVFSDLGLAITDEQHRFGVNQRRDLSRKSGDPVNVLVMTATPIPRSLAATVFGDMDFSMIRQKPNGRKKIITRVLDDSGRGLAYEKVREELSAGHRAYIVAPSIGEDEESELASAEGLFTEMKKKFKGHSVALLHAQMDKAEKEKVMTSFASGKTEILVSTVVIEVGIDVPEASVIVIENSDRFGLAQLHQLRGRVGRSDDQAYCYLINRSRSESAAARMKAMRDFSDGFDISEEDYKIRGPGDIMGTMQHGTAFSRINDFMKYSDIAEKAAADADEILRDKSGKTDMAFVGSKIDMMADSDNSDVI